VERKVCTVTGLDSRGLPYFTLVEAGSLFEAAAAGLEQLHKNGCLITQLQITIHEPGKRYHVHPRQMESWLRSYSDEDNVGLRALKARVRDLLNHTPRK
jgi:hypothetical protein